MCLMGMDTLSNLRAFSESLEKTEKKMPILFIGHGSPMNAIEHNVFSESWLQLATALETPKAVICISAHWLTKGTFVTAMDQPKTIHDFGGFPAALYEMDYPAPGSPELAGRIKAILDSADIPNRLDNARGYDHGTWTPLLLAWPGADIPVVQISINVQIGRAHV